MHFLQHSQFVPEGAYAKIHNKIIELSEQFYKELQSLEFSRFKAQISLDFQFLQNVFLPCTWSIVEKTKLKLELESMQKSFLSEYKSFVPYIGVVDEVCPLLFTAFGKLLFSNDLSPETTRKIRFYIGFLKFHGREKEVKEYNSLVIFT